MKSRAVIARESTGWRIMEQSRVRLWCVGLFFCLCFFSIAWRMCDVALAGGGHAMTVTVTDPDDEKKSEQVDLQSAGSALQRGDIVDRNGVLLATSLMTGSVFVNPKVIIDRREAASKIAGALGMDSAKLLAQLERKKSFVWIKRQLTPREEQRVNSLGIPGLYFAPEEKRVYPYGRLLAHAVGYVGIDNQGLAGIERSLNWRLRSAAAVGQPLILSIDVRLQNIIREEISGAMSEFHASGGAGVILDIHNGEVLSLVSLPDFDPNHPGDASKDARFNRVALGDYEMGSTFKSFTMAMAMQYGLATMKSRYDATQPLKIASFTVHDDHEMHRWLTVPEIYAYSSNIGAARIGLSIGGKRQKAFLEKLGMMQPVDIELPGRASPLYPADWRDINTVTIAYGQGISVTPLHLVRGIAAMVDGGILPRLTLLKGGNDDRPQGARVISEAVSKNIRRLMRLVVEHGTGTKADVPGYDVGGKTGTAQKASHGVYAAHSRLSSFVAVFPINHPRYVVLVMIDDPRGNASTHQFATAGWTAAPAVGRVIARMGPLLGMPPEYQASGDDAEKFWPAAAAEKKVYHVAAE
ncbi:MAG: penicillin-binding protein 2 [Pseudomonadota bacterium]|nr:penicillin-binding protein 2 [Pseudomonadota bacterium]MDE3037436.1 penicillin-binding protein 2 [Pseudomonadota bacterium]